MYRLEVKTLGRGTGASTVNAAAHNTGKSAMRAVAYRMREALYDERTGITHDYSKKFGGNGSDFFAPSNLPAWMNDRQARWNAVEKSEPRKDAKLARDLVITLPYGMTHEQHRAAVKEFVIKHFVSKGRFADVGYHAYGEGTKVTDKGLRNKLKLWMAQKLPFYERSEVPANPSESHVIVLRNKKGSIKEYALFQPHAHVMVPLRTIEGDGFSATKEREPPSVYYKVWYSQIVTAMRVDWADVLNKHLELAGRPERVTHLSLAAQGIDREPEPKKGPIASKMEREGRGDDSHAVVDWRAVKDRNEERGQLKAKSVALEAEIHDLLAARLKHMKQGTRPVQFTDQQFDQRDEQIRAMLGQVANQRQSLQQFDKEYEEEQKRITRLTAPREEEMQTKRNRGDIPDANDRWASAMHKAYNPRVRPEESMALAVGYEAEEFRREQKEMRQAEAKEPDPAKRRMLEYNRQIAACDYMALGAEKCASISGALLGRRNNEISNRDRERAGEWREIGQKLRDDRAELRETITKNIHEEIEAFLKDRSRGPQPATRPQEAREKEQFFGPISERKPTMGRDLPPDKQPVPQDYEPAQQEGVTWGDLSRSAMMLNAALRRPNQESRDSEIRVDYQEVSERKNATREVTNTREEWKPPDISEEKAAKIDARSQHFNEEDRKREEVPEQQRYGGQSR